MKVIPAIIAKTFDELKEKLQKAEPYADWVQIDVCDGVFAPNVTWNNPAELKNLHAAANLEIHLMVADAADCLDAWIDSGAKRLVIPVDYATDAAWFGAAAQKVKSRGVELGVALSPEVSVDEVVKVVPLADTALVLAVSPGFSGQQFKPETLQKIRGLRKQFPGATIEVDGGINPQTAKQCGEVGADILVSASYIFGAKDLGQAIGELASQ